MRGHNIPAISVIIPVYNVEKYLACCLDSALAQTYQNLEIICVNDGSQDASGEILREYQKKDPRVKIITQGNQGLSAARNNGLKEAVGEYIYFLDSDDFIHPQLLEIAYYFITKHNADLVSFSHDIKARKSARRNAENFKKVWKTYLKIDNIEFALTDNPLAFYRKKFGFTISDYVWAKLYRRDLLNGIEFITDIYFEDTPHTVALLRKRPKTVLLNESLYYYRYNLNSIVNLQHKNLQKLVQNRYIGLLFIYEAFKNGPKEEFDFAAKNIVLKYLKDQYAVIKKADKSERPELYRLFTEELIDLDNKKFIGFKLRRAFHWLKFKKLIKKGRESRSNKY